MNLNLKKLQETLRNTIEKDADELIQQVKEGDEGRDLVETLNVKYNQTVSSNTAQITTSGTSLWFDTTFVDPHRRIADLLHEVHGQDGAWNGQSYCQQVTVAGVSTDELNKLADGYKKRVEFIVETANDVSFRALQDAASRVMRKVEAVNAAAETRKREAEEKAKRLAIRPDVEVVAAKHGMTIKKV